MAEIISAILAISLLVGFIILLLTGAAALDGYFDTWLMKCNKCGRIYKAKTGSLLGSDSNTVYTNCIYCKSRNTRKIKDIPKSYKITNEDNIGPKA